jgi:hypothetical protein
VTAVPVELTRPELARALLSALRGVPELRPAPPPATRPPLRLPWDLDLLAVDVTDTRVEIRLVALALPLVPVLHRAAELLRAVLAAGRWRDARLRLVVTDLDAAALTGARFPHSQRSRPTPEVLS